MPFPPSPLIFTEHKPSHMGPPCPSSDVVGNTAELPGKGVNEHPTRGYKYHGCLYNHTVSNYTRLFLVFYTPQGGTELSDRNSGVRY